MATTGNAAMTPEERAKKTAATISGYPHPGVIQCWADAIRAAENDAIERAAKAVDDLRCRTAANFSPEYSGGKGEARCNSLYDAYTAVRALRHPSP